MIISGMFQSWTRFTTYLDSWAVSWGQHRTSMLDIASTVVVLIALYIVTRLVMRFALRLIKRTERLDVSQKALLQKLAGIGIVTIATMIGVDLLGIDLTALAVFSGALGLAVGFGLQKTLGNLIAGLILLMDKSVKPGDVIAVGDTFGSINKIGIRAVSVLTRDGKEHLIPNELLMTEAVENWSYSSKHVRVRIPVGVAYSCDLALAQRLMMEAASHPSRVLADPQPVVWLTGFGDNSVDHEIRIWISDPEDGIGNVQSAVLNRLWILFKENDIEIPFPQRDVHVRTLPVTPQPAASRD
ncbi:MAG: mechanosensitive ion channel [Sphingopyxis sp.]|nr:mechanosensitive ion channel [Sphingopyxis sp.]